MKKFILVLLIAVFPLHAAAEELLIATTTYCPLVCSGVNGPQGIMHDVLTASFADSKYTLRFVNIPYGRAIQETLDGEYAAVTFAGTANSPDFLFVRNFVMTNVVQFAVLSKSKWKYEGISSLNTIRLGIPTGFRTSNTKVDAYISHPPMPNRVVFSSSDNPTSSQIANIERLLVGRLDAMLCGSLAFKYIVKRIGVEGQIRLDPTPIAEFHNHIAFSPNHSQGDVLRKFVEEQIDIMQRDGRLAVLLDKYGLK